MEIEEFLRVFVDDELEVLLRTDGKNVCDSLALLEVLICDTFVTGTSFPMAEVLNDWETFTLTSPLLSCFTVDLDPRAVLPTTSLLAFIDPTALLLMLLSLFLVDSFASKVSLTVHRPLLKVVPLPTLPDTLFAGRPSVCCLFPTDDCLRLRATELPLDFLFSLGLLVLLSFTGREDSAFVLSFVSQESNVVSDFTSLTVEVVLLCFS